MRLLLGLALVLASACSEEAECGEGTDLECPVGEICIFEGGLGTCAQPCQTDDDCTEGGSCESCLASGDCPACDVCVSACQ